MTCASVQNTSKPVDCLGHVLGLTDSEPLFHGQTGDEST